MTRKPLSLPRWSLTRHLIGQHATVVTERSGVSTSDETNITEGTNERNEDMTNPFHIEVLPAAFINISACVHASKDVEQSLLGIISKGTQMMESFVTASLSTIKQFHVQACKHSVIWQNKQSY